MAKEVLGLSASYIVESAWILLIRYRDAEFGVPQMGPGRAGWLGQLGARPAAGLWPSATRKTREVVSRVTVYIQEVLTN